MPQVPTQSEFAVAAQPLNSKVQVDSIASAEDYGLIQAKQLNTVSTEVAQVGAAVQLRQNTDQVFRAEAQLKQDALQFHTEQEQRKGVNAWDMTKDTTKWWNEQGEKYRGQFDNDDQRQAFLKTFTNLRSQGLSKSSSQEANERRSSLEDSSKASIVGSINNAAANYGTPGAVTSAVDDITTRVQATSRLNGWTPERRDMEMATNLTSLHKQVIQNMVQNDPEQALRYYDTYKEQISGTERDGVDKLIKGAKFTKASEAFGDAAVVSGMSEADAINAARAKYSGEEEKQVVLEVKTRYQERSKAREDMQRDAADQAWGIYARTGRVSAIPQSVIAGLDGRVLMSLKHDAEAKADKASGGKVKTDTNAYYELRTLAATDPEAFAKRDLRGDFSKLDEADREKFINLQQDVRKPKKVADVVAVGSQLADAHELLGWKASDGPKKGAFDRAVTNEIDAEQTRTGKPLGFKERQAVIDRMMIDGKVEGAGFLGFGSRKKAYEVAGTPSAAKFVPKPSDDDRDAVVASLKAKNGGKAPTDDQILQTYRKWKGI